MSVPDSEVQKVLFRETISLLATYSWTAAVDLNPYEFGRSDPQLSMNDFIRELRFRHSLASAARLHPIISEIEESPSRVARTKRSESVGVIRGRLDIPRYTAHGATNRSWPRRYPVINRTTSFDTPENRLASLAISEVRKAMRDNPFPKRNAEAKAASSLMRWAVDKERHRPWQQLNSTGQRGLLINEVESRTRRAQTSNVSAYRRLLRWFEEWTLDVRHLGEELDPELVSGFLDFPSGSKFWDRVFEIWCLLFVAATLDDMGWERLRGPVALHAADNVIYEYESKQCGLVRVRYQHKLPGGRWRYRNADSLRGYPDITIDIDDSDCFPLIIDAKNKRDTSATFTRSEDCLLYTSDAADE